MRQFLTFGRNLLTDSFGTSFDCKSKKAKEITDILLPVHRRAPCSHTTMARGGEQVFFVPFVPIRRISYQIPQEASATCYSTITASGCRQSAPGQCKR